MRTRTRTALICGSAVLAAATVCSADTLPIMGDMANSTEGLADFTGSITYTPLGGMSGSLQISLTNTTAPAIGGFITGFVFNIGGTDPAATATFVSGPTGFSGFTDVNASPFGMDFDAGASTAPPGHPQPFEGAGNPSTGLGVGETGLFTFAISATDAATLMASDFLFGGGEEFNFIVRFRGLANDGSDKVPATVIPLPGAASLAGVGLLGLAGVNRRRR